MHSHIILGGTFDRFHAGHELFIQTALERGERITVGITTSPLYQHKPLSQIIERYKVREANVDDYISKNRSHFQKVTIIPITDVYGSSLIDLSIDAICVTLATKKTAFLINERRKQTGMKPLKIITVPWVRGPDGQVISSERIRYGEIDRKGKKYYKALIDRECCILPTSLLPMLRKPLGEVFSGKPGEEKYVAKRVIDTIQRFHPPMVFAIGDIIAESLREAGFTPSVTVIDHRSRREALPEVQSTKFKVKSYMRYSNGAGTIEASAVRRLRSLCSSYLKSGIPQSLVIDGEEDLMVLPAVLMAPLGSFVLYGQQGLGVVAVKVTEIKKDEVLRLVSEFNLL